MRKASQSPQEIVPWPGVFPRAGATVRDDPNPGSLGNGLGPPPEDAPEEFPKYTVNG